MGVKGLRDQLLQEYLTLDYRFGIFMRKARVVILFGLHRLLMLSIVYLTP